MKISSSDIQQRTQSTSTQEISERERLAVNVQKAISDAGTPAPGEMLVLSQQAQVSLTQADKIDLMTKSTVQQAGKADAELASRTLIESALRTQLAGAEAVTLLNDAGVSRHPISGEASLAMNRYVYVHDAQSSTSSLQGTLTTEDGREIQLVMHLGMEHSQSLSVNQSMSIEKRAFHDPLILNFGAATTTLTDKQFMFDINGDGQQEQLAQLGQGSGFLVFDRNQDGTINDGTEMFGLKSGNGFDDLAIYDTDANRWIDENDPIFKQLQIMTINERGQQELVDLKTAGVGAIYLGSNATQVSLTNSSGLMLGQIKRSGLFLMENGEAKTIQELDFAELKSRPAQNANEAFFTEQVIASTPPDAPPPPDQTFPPLKTALRGTVFQQISSALDASKMMKDQMDEAFETPEKSFEILLLEKMQWIRVRHKEDQQTAAGAYQQFLKRHTDL